MRCNTCGQKDCCGASLGPELEAITAERDRLKEALKRIDAVTYTHDHEYGLTLARIARSALQEAP